MMRRRNNGIQGSGAEVAAPMLASG